MSDYSVQKFFQRSIALICAGIMICLLASGVAFAGFIQLDGVADVKTRFSRGCSTLQEVAELARVRGIDTVIFGDQARDALEYGLFPFERVIKKRYENSSVLTVGTPAYISEISDNDKQFEETLLVTGSEVAPFYYWTEENSLVANNPDKHLFVTGFKDSDSYEQLPILNSNFSKSYLVHYQYFFGGCVVFFLLCLIPAIKRFKRKTAGIMAGVMFLLAVNNHPFQSSPFNQHSGDQGVQPYQELIDYVDNNGGLIFWNHMEAVDGIRQEGQIGYKTEPYPEDLVLTSNYTGFQSVANFPVRPVDPGNEWDQVLGEYLQGQREKPVWGYGGSNYLCESEKTKLGDIRTVFLVRQKSRSDVLNAMARGRMYAVRQTGRNRLSLDDFTITDSKSGRKATLGEDLKTNDFPELKIKVRLTQGGEKSARLSVIRNGLEVKQDTVTLPYELVWRDVDLKREEGPVFYRLKVEMDAANYLVSNPIFVHFVDEMPAHVASVPERMIKESSMIEPVKPKVQFPQNPIRPSVNSPKLPVQDKVASKLKPPQIESTIEAHSLNLPVVEQPKVSKVIIPSASSTPLPIQPSLAIKKSVVAKIDGVSLKNGPGPKFPEVGRLNKGDSLPLIRNTTVEFNGNPWLIVDIDGRKAYVWSKLVTTE